MLIDALFIMHVFDRLVLALEMFFISCSYITPVICAIAEISNTISGLVFAIHAFFILVVAKLFN